MFVLQHGSSPGASRTSSTPARPYGALTGAQYIPTTERVRRRRPYRSHSQTSLKHDTDHQYKQYLAVAPFPSRNHSPMVGARVQRPSAACIQIWSLGRSGLTQEDAMDVDGDVGSGTDRSEDQGEMRCEMVLCIDSGPAFELKWCPLPSNDPAIVGGPCLADMTNLC